MQIDEKFVEAQCFKCKHLVFNSVEFSCPAFKEIPEDILINRFVHTEKHPDQKNNILFEPIEEEDNAN